MKLNNANIRSMSMKVCNLLCLEKHVLSASVILLKMSLAIILRN